MTSLEARLACASACILQSPPGEVNDVFNDIRALVGDDDALETGILPALEQYNVEQYIVAQLPDHEQLLICQAGKTTDSPERFIEPRGAKSWVFDHLRLTASDPIDLEVDSACETTRTALEQAAQSYAKEHLTEGVSKVFTTHQTRLKKPKPVKQAPEVHAAEPVSATQKAAAESAEDAEAIIENDQAAVSSAPPVVSEASSSDSAGPPSQVAEIGGAESIVATDDVDMHTANTPSAVEAETIEAEEGVEIPAVSAEKEAATTAPAPQMQEIEQEEQEELKDPLPLHFSLYFVGNKYNPSNYWTGRWRSAYTLDMSGSKAELSGHIQINVHFFEQGNVQLATNVKPSLSLPDSITVASSPQDIAKAVIKVISKAEEEYQLELNEAYRELSEKTFRSLRRALPITRQKMDWAKVANYKVGKDLTSVKAP